LLERRLDAVVYRLKFAPTVFAARQLVSHGHVMLNGKRADISSMFVKEGDEISLNPKMRENVQVLEGVSSQERQVPDYLEVVDQKAFKGKFVRTPKLLDVPYPVQMEPNLVIEFYSR
jgi:small subunit ribosomal protein S4